MTYTFLGQLRYSKVHKNLVEGKYSCTQEYFIENVTSYIFLGKEERLRKLFENKSRTIHDW